jgi:tyrosyl-tRNA synthetase
MGLQGPQKMGFESSEKLDTEVSSKMSKSLPKSSIYIHDSEEEIKDKINKAYCPEKQTEGNPVIELCEYVVMRDKPLHIERSKKYGGDIDYTQFDELKKAYEKGELHPTDLKNAVANELLGILKPSREYFGKHHELLDIFKEGKITR